MNPKLKIISDIKKIDKILKKHWGARASKQKPVKPKLKIVVFYLEEKEEVKAYLYVYDISDGYFHECILDDLVTGTEEKLNTKQAALLLKKLIDYCKKEKIERIRAKVDKDDKEELKLYKKFKFDIYTNQISAEY